MKKSFFLLLFPIFSFCQEKCILGDCENGQGTKIFSDGMKYVGEWKDGKAHGQGIQTWDDSESKYVGEWKDGKHHGKGHFIYAPYSYLKDEYVGEFKNGKRDGKGTYTYTWPKDKYVGEWKEGKRYGQGTLIRADGIVQEGLWNNLEYLGPTKTFEH